ncbi:MAG: cell division protein FtsQ/DivIB [Eubacteriales bacterium]|nr:cell division protein FtsQ/DivIB [Eubacteriales bacterium]
MNSDYEFRVIENKKQKSIIGPLTAVLLLLIMIVLLIAEVNDIKVMGNKTYTDKEVEELLFVSKWDRNPVVILVKEFAGKKKRLPFVDSYSIELTSPVSADVIIYEKKPIGYVHYMDSNMYFDKDGVIIESTDNRMEDIPEITGLKFGRIVMNKRLEVADVDLYEQIMNITNQLSSYNIPCSQIYFDSSRNVTVYVDGGDIRVKIGQDDYLATKLSLLNDVIDKMRERGMKGTVDLSGYSDIKSDSFSFIPD